MRDLDKALADIFAIRSQIAAGTAFRGYGPATVAATGGLALFTAFLQFLWLDDPTGRCLVPSRWGVPGISWQVLQRYCWPARATPCRPGPWACPSSSGSC